MCNQFHCSLFHCSARARNCSRSRNLRKVFLPPGLVLELPNHKNEYATKYLSSKGFYVLVEKRTVISPSNDPNGKAPSQEVQYVPLLQSPSDKFKGYRARVAERGPSQEQSANRSTAGRGGKKGARLKQRKSVVEPTSPV